MENTNTEYFIRTYNEEVLNLVEGCLYSAIGTSGMTKDKEVTGKLKYSLFGEWFIADATGRYCSINERTLKAR